jgi:hypothetical protein
VAAGSPGESKAGGASGPVLAQPGGVAPRLLDCAGLDLVGPVGELGGLAVGGNVESGAVGATVWTGRPAKGIIDPAVRALMRTGLEYGATRFTFSAASPWRCAGTEASDQRPDKTSRVTSRNPERTDNRCGQPLCIGDWGQAPASRFLSRRVDIHGRATDFLPGRPSAPTMSVAKLKTRT